VSGEFSVAELDAYLDEALPAPRMAEIEAKLRSHSELRQRLAQILGQRDSGLHSIGEVWRRQRASCPSREEWGSYLLGVLEDGKRSYMEFHLQQVGCRWCEASLVDLQATTTDAPAEAPRRQKRYFQSSAGYLKSISGE
jgi:hypothetical protein